MTSWEIVSGDASLPQPLTTGRFPSNYIPTVFDSHAESRQIEGKDCLDQAGVSAFLTVLALLSTTHFGLCPIRKQTFLLLQCPEPAFIRACEAALDGGAQSPLPQGPIHPCRESNRCPG
ncbi:hypothetical protein MIND_00167100 [Mycena indigotica]|uniref:Uncharacterized protein n=1 Tax=Mycena indigotica TaxID=2126181 RepID=A0A8H6TIR6_9AGAR|nr:uncharacterized protein MIND_00167100 [Mycena indigotica]KAF7316480.1 hypothetical protein MIND_00167100 [Mycena indigotica]